MHVVSYRSQVGKKCADGRFVVTTFFKNLVVQSKVKRCIRAIFLQDSPQENKLEHAFIETRNKCASRIIASHDAVPELNPRKASCNGSSCEWAKISGIDPIIAE